MENQKYHIRLNTARVMGEHTINSLPLKTNFELLLVSGTKTWLFSLLSLTTVL